MADKSGIAWTDATWNPVTGCTKVSQGCKHCYAERDWKRLTAAPHTVYAGRVFNDVQVHPERLDQPLRWRRPRRIFVNSMSDLFHEDVPTDFVDRVLAVMMLSPRHIFQVLTKRPERMRDYLADPKLYERVLLDVNLTRLIFPKLRLDEVPVSNPTTAFARHIWWGVSVEDQEAADTRIPVLLETPVAVRWVSMEPLLAPVSLGYSFRETAISGGRLAWVVVGGESGPRARLLDLRWVRDIRDACRSYEIPFFMKQLGARYQDGGFLHTSVHRAGAAMWEWPEDLRVQEYPATLWAERPMPAFGSVGRMSEAISRADEDVGSALSNARMLPCPQGRRARE